MFRVFEGQTADEVWSKVADAFRNGEGTSQPSRLGEMREILHSAMSIRQPRQRWIASRFSPINPAFAIAEIVWIINGRNDARFLNYFNSRLPNFAGHDETYHGAYGYRLRQNLGIDQLERAYHALRNNSSSRQIVLQIWDGKIDLPDSRGKEAAPDVPCNIVSLLKVRNGRLEWMQIMRSNDLYLGLPYNIVQFTTLHEVMAGWLGLELGEYNQVSNSLHVYKNDLDSVAHSGTIASGMNVDSLMCGKEESEQHFLELAALIEMIIDERETAESLESLVKQSELPASFRNLLRVVCAEGVRRRKRHELVDRIMNDCSNPALKDSFDRWIDSLAHKKETRLAKTRIFISYRNEDLSMVRGFHLLRFDKNVEVDFVGRHLLDPVLISDEQYIKNQINEMLRGTSAMVLLMGAKSTDSRWVEYEIEQSHKRGNDLFVIQLAQPQIQIGSAMDRALKMAGARIIEWPAQDLLELPQRIPQIIKAA